MELQKAKAIADDVVSRLFPYCQRIEVAGSVRRRRPVVNDIDLVLIPKDPWQLYAELKILAGDEKMKADGPKLKRLMVNGEQLDVYFATEETWATLLLIRTGSKESNIRLATAAWRKGWQLKANGDGLFNEREERIAGDTEESIYEQLGLPYQVPERR